MHCEIIIKLLVLFTTLVFLFCCRERPAAITIEIKSIDDTSNFDDFPESDILQPGESAH